MRGARPCAKVQKGLTLEITEDVMRLGNLGKGFGLLLGVLAVAGPAWSQQSLPAAVNETPQRSPRVRSETPPADLSDKPPPAVPESSSQTGRIPADTPPATTTPATPPATAGELAGPVPSLEPNRTSSGGDLLPVHDCHVCDQAAEGIFFSGEYLLIRPRRGAFDFAIVDPNGNGVPEGNVESVDWKTTSGLRVGAFCRLPGEGWEFGLTYTYFHSSGNRALLKPAGGTLFATVTHPGSIEEVDSAAAETSLNFNVLDAEVGRRFRLGESFVVRLFGGGRFAWIDQNFSVFYNGGDALGATVLSPVEFEGAGLRFGAEAQWRWAWGFSLYGRISQSLLVGDFRTKFVELNNFGATTDANVSNRFEQLVPVTEVGIGIAWECNNMRISVGYELANWFNMVDSPGFVDDLNQGTMLRRTSDLSLEGLNVQVGWIF